MPFGFPSGEGLVSRILENLEEGHPTRDVLSHAIEALEPTHTIDNFHEALFYSGRLSIDAFLEHNRQFLKVGKMAIASVLVPLENEKNLFSTSPNWYKLLFKHLNTRFGEFVENKLSILTYNYDRSLEQFLLTALRHAYQGMKDKYTQCWDQLSRIPIVHLHGSLGEFPHAGPDQLGPLERFYEPNLSRRDVSVCAETIRVMSENSVDQPQFKQAYSLLRSAEVICFLGFGWDKTNLDRLEVNTADNLKADRQRYGTAYKKGRAEQDWLHRYFGGVGGINLGDSNQKIVAFLRDFPVLL